MKFRYWLVLFFVMLLNSTGFLIAQGTKTINGTIIENYGKIFPVDNADLHLSTDTEYRVLFDVYMDDSKKSKINPLINTVARFINMHVYHGVPIANLKIALVLHGAATKSALGKQAFHKKFGYDNPDIPLIHALAEAGVEVFVCGQSFLAYGFQGNQKAAHVKLGLSALTVLTEYQTNEYQIINFN